VLLALSAAVIVYDFVQWLITPNDPQRYETATVSALVLLYSFPAGFGVLVAGAVPRTGLSLIKRVGGIVLALFCIGFFMAHNYLQARYR